MSFHCPHCGQPVARPGRPVPTNQYVVQRSAFGSDLVDGADLAEFVRPARAAVVSSDVAVPLLQSAVSGFVIGLVAIVPAAHYSLHWLTPLAVAGVVFALTWFLFLREHRRSLWQVERYERDPLPQTQPVPTARVRLQVDEADGQQVKFAHLPVDLQTLRTVARGLNGGRSFAVSSWCGRGRPLTRAQFETLRDWLITNGYAQWVDERNRNRGVEFTSRGRALWRSLADVRAYASVQSSGAYGVHTVEGRKAS